MANEGNAAAAGVRMIPKGYQPLTEQRGYTPTAAQPGPPPTSNTAVVTPAAPAAAAAVTPIPASAQE